jgi:predicted Ser/Thr protein kinase
VVGDNSGSAGSIVAPESVFLRLAIVCAAGSLVIFASAQPYSPLGPALVSLSIMAGLSLALAYMPEDTLLRSAAIVATALLAAPLGYFFGPNSAFAAILALLIAMTGLLSARQPGRRAKTGWLVMGVVGASQLGVVILVAYDVLPDSSLAPSKRAEFAAWQAVTAHLVVTSVIVSAFLAGRAAQKRYRKLVLDALDASRSVAIREALLEEARADYERALALQAVAEATTSEPSTQGGGTDKITLTRTDREAPPTEPTREELVPQPRPSVAVVDDGAHVRWSQALRSKMRVQDAFVLGTCVAGIYFTASLVKSPTPRIVSLVAIIGIAVMIAIRALILYSKPAAVVAWPYPVIAALSAGPAYGFGLHSAFAAIVATFVFTGRLFRSPGNHLPTVYAILAVCIPHGAVFALVMAGVLPDTSNLPLQLPGFSAAAAIVHHVAVQAIYIGAYILGGRIDREFVRAFEVARFAYGEAMRADARLQIARTELDAALEVEGLFTGTTLGGYQLGRLLGRGGMGEVYEADARGARVALKVLRADRLGDPVALERFEHEANLLMRIASPYCAKVIEVSSSAVPYLAMEYVDGPALSAVLRERGRLDHGELIALVDDLACGLGDVHAAGVVHLDLKPSNVLRGGTRWKIVDFGISRMLTGEAHRRVAGTPPYMAPEQALGEPLDTRTDLYALSLIIYRAITGRPAFTGSDAAVIANRARELGPPDPRALVSIDDDLALVLRIGLAARMADRFATAAELRNAFIGALGGRLDPVVRNRGRALLARAPWALYVSLVTGRMEVSRSTR